LETNLPANDFAAAGKEAGDAKCFNFALCGMPKKTCKGTYGQANFNVPHGACKD
jgi:hypothetical protein